MTKIRIYPYKQGSKSAKALAETVNGKVLKLQGSKYKPRDGDVVVNWGASNVPDFGPATVLNKDVSIAQCKMASLIKMHQLGVRVPDFVTKGQNRINPNRTVYQAAGDMGFPIVCRTKLRGHSGDGIVIANNDDELVDAPLYTKYVKKKDEYRVHVMQHGDYCGAFLIQRKARKLDVENPDWQIRNLAGGFVFTEVDMADTPEDVITQACAALKALNLDFGGVDVLWNEKEGKAYVLETNTACGLEERTAERYKSALDHYVEVAL